MEKYNIEYSLVSNIQCVEGDHRGIILPKPIQRLNSMNKTLEKTIRFARKYQEKIGVLVWLKPRTEQPDDHFKELILKNRDMIYGFKLHPFHSRVAPDDGRLDAYYKLAGEFDLPIVSHTGGCAEAMSDRLYNAAKAHPELNFVMVHMDLGTDNKQALELLGKLPNLYGDTTWVPTATTLETIRRYGSTKMIFGSDNPIDGKDTYLHNKTGDRSLYQEYFNEFKKMVSASEYDDLMYKNAIRIFNIKRNFN